MADRARASSMAKWRTTSTRESHPCARSWWMKGVRTTLARPFESDAGAPGRFHSTAIQPRALHRSMRQGFVSPPITIASCTYDVASRGSIAPRHRHHLACRWLGSEAGATRPSTSTYRSPRVSSSDANASCVSIPRSFHRCEPRVSYVGGIRSRDPIPPSPRWGAGGWTG